MTKRLKINKGDELDLVEEGNSLVITPESSNHTNLTKITVKKPKRLVSRTLYNLYRKGSVRDNCKV